MSTVFAILDNEHDIVVHLVTGEDGEPKIKITDNQDGAFMVFDPVVFFRLADTLDAVLTEAVGKPMTLN